MCLATVYKESDDSVIFQERSPNRCGRKQTGPS